MCLRRAPDRFPKENRCHQGRAVTAESERKCQFASGDISAACPISICPTGVVSNCVMASSSTQARQTKSAPRGCAETAIWNSLWTKSLTIELPTVPFMGCSDACRVSHSTTYIRVAIDSGGELRTVGLIAARGRMISRKSYVNQRRVSIAGMAHAHYR